MPDKTQLKDSILKVFAEKGDYAGMVDLIKDDEKNQNSTRIVKLMEPISAFADMLTENTSGVLMDNLTSRLDEAAQKSLAHLIEQVESNKADLKKELASLVSKTAEQLTESHLVRYNQAEQRLTNTLTELATKIVLQKANEMLPTLSEQARLTEEEIESLVNQAALVVESQIKNIVGQYIDEQGVSVSQIQDFTENVQKLLPQVDFSKISVDWSQIRNAPSVGGTNTNIVRQIVNEAVAGLGSASAFTDLTDTFAAYTGLGGQFVRVKATEDGLETATPAGSGDVVKVGTPVNNQIGVWTGNGTIEGDASLTWDGTSFNIATAKNLQIAGATVLADAAGTTTLSNIDALDATTEATIEAAIDTLANLTSVQSQTITLSGSLTVESASVVNQDLSSDASPTFAGASFSDGNITNVGIIDVDNIKADSTAGVIIESQDGTDVGLLGASNTANVTWYGSHDFSTATQDTIAGFTGAGKTLGSLSVATYPTLTELSYVKGVTSSIQTQINALSGGGITWSEVTGTTQAAAVNNGYVANNASQVVITLPDTAALGSVVRVIGKGAGGWRVSQNASEQIHFGAYSTTSGTGGYLASSNQYDAVELVCITANTTWAVLSSVGNITYV